MTVHTYTTCCERVLQSCALTLCARVVVVLSCAYARRAPAQAHYSIVRQSFTCLYRLSLSLFTTRTSLHFHCVRSVYTACAPRELQHRLSLLAQSLSPSFSPLSLFVDLPASASAVVAVSVSASACLFHSVSSSASASVSSHSVPSSKPQPPTLPLPLCLRLHRHLFSPLSLNNIHTVYTFICTYIHVHACTKIRSYYFSWQDFNRMVKIYRL